MNEAWNDAEEAIKLAEQVNKEVVSPAVYELRYAGRKLVEADQLIGGDDAGALDLLRDARMDCLRARHDAIDAATSKILYDLDVAIKKLGASRVMGCFPDWSETYRQISSVRERISVSRKDRSDRDAIYRTIEAVDLPKTVRLYNQFKSAEPNLISETRTDRLKLLGGYAIGIIGALIGGICFFV